MPHAPSLRLRKAALLATLLAPVSAFADFLHTDAGPYDYNTGANWSSGINNQLTSSLTADQVITFGANTTLSSGLTINNSSTFNHTIRGTSGDFTLTLGGNISLGGSATNTNSVTVGSGSAGSRLNMDLGGSNRVVAVGTNRTLEFLDVISGTGSITKNGAGTLKLTNTANTFTGGISIGGGSPSQFGGVLEVTKLANSGQASSIGAGTSITFGGANGAATLRYIGSSDSSSNRTFTIGSQGAIFESSGTGALQFTNTGTIDVSPSNTVSRTITFTGTNTDANSFAGVIRDPSVSAQTSVLKQDAGRWLLAGANTYTGDTTIDAGTLELGSSHRIADTSNLVLNGGTFATGGFSETFGTLDVNGNATIDFGSGDSDLVFADSSAIAWGASISLSIINFNEGVDSIRFGTTNEGLDVLTQLAKITINGSAVAIDDQGFISTIPEPSTYAAFAGVGALFLALRRRSRDS